MRKIAIYVGRFQPFHKGHDSAYQQLVDKFGEENVYIGTSDPKETSERNPFKFGEKKQIMTAMFGIPTERVVKVKNPYKPQEILSRFDPEKTAFITAVGEKDGDRLSHGKYFKKYDADDELSPYLKRGYFVTVPNFKVDSDVMSATKIRDKLGNPAISTEDKIDFFKKVYGKLDPKLFRMMRDTIQTRSTEPKKSAEPKKRQRVDPSILKRRVTNPQTRRDILVKTALQYGKDHPAHKLARKMFKRGTMNEVFESVMIENALIDQYNSLVDDFIGKKGRNIRIELGDSQATIEDKCKEAYKHGVFYYPLVNALNMVLQDEEEPELEEEPALDEKETSTARVRKYYKRHPERVRRYLKKTQDDRVIRNRDRQRAIRKHGKAKMKNHDVHHPNGVRGGKWVLAKKDHGRDRKNPKSKLKNEIFLVEGGAAGHMMHPYEDVDLTFDDYKEIIDQGLLGSMGEEKPVTEKLDGQNIAFSVVNGEIRFARNKGHVKNGGDRALTVKGMMDKFKDRGGLERAFVGAARDLETAIKVLPDDQVKEMFGNGSKFMSVEIILPDSTNVIPYDKNVLVFHGTIEYDKDGKPVASSQDDAKTFSDQILKVGQHKQKIFGLQGPKVITFNDKDIKKMKGKTKEFHREIDRLKNEFGLKDDDLVRDYYAKWWEREVKKELDQHGLTADDDTMEGLINRFAFDDKTMQLKDIRDPEIRKWTSDYQKTRLRDVKKVAQNPFEMVFLKVGATSLERIKDFLASNNPGAIDQIRKELKTAMNSVRAEDVSDRAEKLRKEFDRLQQVGLDKLVPSEGIVFIYKGQPYKFTGTFAPLNQILGTFKFGGKPEGEPDAAAPGAPAGAPDPEKDKDFIKKYYSDRVRNPMTGKDITVQSALTYDKTHPVYNVAIRYLSSKMG